MRGAPRPGGRVVAIGGGTGLPMVLRGLKHRALAGEIEELTAVVTMSDDGGSSGRLRRSRGVPPPGDVRNCLVALCVEEDLLTELFQHRYEGGELGGHSLGNLILTALAEQTGSFLTAVEASARVLRTAGRILPVTEDDVTLVARLESGAEISGETAIGKCATRIESVRLDPETSKATPGVVHAIYEADLVVVGPGSMLTSVIPNLVLPEVAQALRETQAARVMVGNLVREPGESEDLGMIDHLRLLERHVGAGAIDAILIHEGPIDPQVRKRYEAEGASALPAPGEAPDGVRLVRADLVGRGSKLRHDPDATAEALLGAWAECRDNVRSRSRLGRAASECDR